MGDSRLAWVESRTVLLSAPDDVVQRCFASMETASIITEWFDAEEGKGGAAGGGGAAVATDAQGGAAAAPVAAAAET